MLSDKECRKGIQESLYRIEEGELHDANSLMAFLAMNGIDTPSIIDKVKASYVLGELKRSNFVHKRYSPLLIIGLKKQKDGSKLPSGEIDIISRKVSDNYSCNYHSFVDNRSFEDFLMNSFKDAIINMQPTTVAYHFRHPAKGDHDFSEYVCFRGLEILSGGFAQNWSDKLELKLFGEKSIIEPYARQLEKVPVNYMGIGSEVNDINLGSMPLVDMFMRNIQDYYESNVRGRKPQ